MKLQFLARLALVLLCLETVKGDDESQPAPQLRGTVALEKSQEFDHDKVSQPDLPVVPGIGNEESESASLDQTEASASLDQSEKKEAEAKQPDVSKVPLDAATAESGDGEGLGGASERSGWFSFPEWPRPRPPRNPARPRAGDHPGPK
eukprot:Skav230232  [mRNA]  locus=scaffold4204:86945:87388:- [translate_table: standard]